MKLDFDIINATHYQRLMIKSNPLTPEENNQVKAYEDYIQKATKYEDYLQGDTRNLVNDHKRNMDNLIDTSEHTPDILNNNKIKHAIDAYIKTMDNSREFKYEKARILDKDLDKSSGYANAFVIILSLIATGILISFILITIIKISHM